MLEFFRKGRADFFFLLIDSMKVVHDGICALKTYLEDQNKVNAGKVFTLQREAEEKRRLLLDELNKTFATPIDREDLYAMSKTMDDIMDYGKSTVEELEVFGLKPDAYLLKLAGCLAAGSGEILSAIERLERNPGVAMEHAVQAKKIENEMETIYRDALVELFKGPDVIHMLKMREIYRHLSNAADRINEAGDVINSIVVKTS